MTNCIDDDQARRVAQARLALQRILTRLRAAEFQCELAQTRDGAYERIALAYSQSGQDRHVITGGWAIGEQDNEALAFTWMTLEALKLLGRHQ